MGDVRVNHLIFIVQRFAEKWLNLGGEKVPGEKDRSQRLLFHALLVVEWTAEDLRPQHLPFEGTLLISLQSI